jgi:hypothetical protein
VPNLPFRIESLGGTFINMSILIPHAPGQTAAVEQIVCLLEQQVHAYNLTIKRLTAKEIGAFNWDGTHAVRLSGSAADCERFQSSVDVTVHEVLNGAAPPETRKKSKAKQPVSANSAPAMVATSLANFPAQPTAPGVDPRILRKAQQAEQRRQQRLQQEQLRLQQEQQQLQLQQRQLLLQQHQQFQQQT